MLDGVHEFRIPQRLQERRASGRESARRRSRYGHDGIRRTRAGPTARLKLLRGLIFEQPLNERMRTFLRLDLLYNQALYQHRDGEPRGSRAAMSRLIDILAITTRGDVRSDVLKELEAS